MKHTKKILVFILTIAIVLTFGQAAMAENQELPTSTQSGNICLLCGATYGRYSHVETVETIYVTRCAHSNTPHNHTRFVEYVYRCRCYNNGSVVGTGTRCPFYGVLSLDQTM